MLKRPLQSIRTMSKLSPLQSSKLRIRQDKSPSSPLPNEHLKFGQSLTNHISKIQWNDQKGWASPEIVPYGPLVLDPSACVFHYSFELCEGLKAYRDSEDKIRMFRPDRNMERMNKSAHRIVLPTSDSEELT
jgi:branched-chain amino acid aminotransferase